ncbi:BBLF1 [macacine gammaherpesvirus 10]|uniref:Cytoplasmic envelopment protein 3 n=1 Tax=macacine gammaherpesvirus 10 TaxID=2560569 RepID=A0A0S0DIH4_9GAMA|nr:BBLF1 [macacine gammaherpesvirus 10]ALF03248.1 BBLF1 [macacine gammaherpesvirus 10]
MGALWSLCRRRVNSIANVDGGMINLYDDYEAFNMETSMLMAAEEGRAGGETNEGLEGDESEEDELPFLSNKRSN